MSVILINPFAHGGIGGPSPSQDTDPNFASVVSLLHFDGADGATTFTDNAPGSPTRIWTPSGNAQIDTAQSKFGGASGLFDGAGDYLETADSPDWHFGSGDFTIEAWVRLNALGANQSIVLQIGATFTNAEVGFGVLVATDNKLSCFIGDGTVTLKGHCTGGSALTTGQWYHIAYTRNSTDFATWIDGTQNSTASGSETQANSTQVVRIARADASNNFYLNGWIDDLRITKGVARYTGNFTPPSSAFPDS
jgi:hypothetical protein